MPTCLDQICILEKKSGMAASFTKIDTKQTQNLTQDKGHSNTNTMFNINSTRQIDQN